MRQKTASHRVTVVKQPVYGFVDLIEISRTQLLRSGDHLNTKADDECPEY